MKKYIVKSIMAAVALTAAGCANFDEMNENPYAVYDAPAESFVQPMLYNTEYALVQRTYDLVAELVQYSVNRSTEITSQMNYNYSITESVVASLWQNLYLQAGNAEYMLETAEKESNPAMKGVAMVMKVLIMSNIADTYGNVPYFDAAKIASHKGDISYTTTYDEQNLIYADMLRLLEDANRAFGEANELVSAGTLSTADFSPLCDYMYEGDVDKWRRFGNSLYLRLLMRVSLKVEEEGGLISLGEEYGEMNVRNKIAELYDCFLSGSGDYPMMRGRSDAALVGFSKYNSALYTPFYSTTSGIWNSVVACNTLVDKMYDKAAGFEDPRLNFYFTKPMGAPTQWLKSDLDEFMETNVSSLGNSLVGRYPRGIKVTGDYISDLQNADHYALMNYSELLFIFAEAGQRGWLNIAYPQVKQHYLRAVTEAVLEWHPYVTESSENVVKFIDTLSSEIDADNALDKILTQKWISLFWVGIESWCDYRRTGYPLLKTNGPAAENNGILPTRMRYPADEKYRNPNSYADAVGGWLGGSNNMQTDVWWASTAESRAMRLKGRQ
ncbi:MAG: SusD/RagB family nutrient-binding outer membrane lipoprotein [Alistipes sp.]|nr:SusD/RagB family nutrient-binding outer membrane lipoprotein [Alistipes sp.]